MGKTNENSNRGFLPSIAIPPGETIKDYLESLGMKQNELATRLDMSVKHLSNIITGSAPITYETALKLEAVIGPSAEFWINLENNYQLDKARLEEQSKLIQDYEVLKERGMQVPVLPLNRTKLKAMIPEFRKLTLETPEIFYKEMKKLCAECGIALVLVECVPKTYINGATIWKGDKAILALSVRGKKADIFWFTFFHELAHLIEHHKKEFHISFEKDEVEDEADCMARNYLISDDIYNNFIDKYDYYNPNIIKCYAESIGIAPCILVGRLLHDKLIEYKQCYDVLRPSFSIVKRKE